MDSDPLDFGNVIHEVMEVVHIDPDADVKSEYSKAWEKYGIVDMEYYEMGLSNINSYVHRSFQEKGDAETIGCEWRFVLDATDMRVFHIVNDEEFDRVMNEEMTKHSVPVASTIDRMDLLPNGNVAIYDYKTNRRRFSRSQIDNSLQLGLYALAVDALGEKVEKCVYDMFHFGFEKMQIDDEKLLRVRSFLVDLWTKCGRWEDEGWPERINNYCGWCHRKTECDAFASVMSWGGPPGALSFEEAVKRRKLAAHSSKLLRQELRSLDELISGEMVERGEFSIETLEGRVEMKSSTRRYYDPQKLIEYAIDNDLFDDMMDCVTVSKTKAEKLLRFHGLVDQCESFLETRRLSPSISVVE